MHDFKTLWSHSNLIEGGVIMRTVRSFPWKATDWDQDNCVNMKEFVSDNFFSMDGSAAVLEYSFPVRNISTDLRDY